MDRPRDHTKWRQRNTIHHLCVEYIFFNAKKKNDTNEIIYKTDSENKLVTKGEG